jgi:hypothetical protein
MIQSYTILEEILLYGAPFDEGFSFTVEKPAGPMRKRSIHYPEAPGKNISPRMLNFSQIHHQTHTARQRKKNRALAFMGRLQL